jgi:putative NADPH-quinone reductase
MSNRALLTRTGDLFVRRPPRPFVEAANTSSHQIRRLLGSKGKTEAIVWAEHIVFVFPLWLGTMPALLKAFLEQVMRPGTAFAYPDKGGGFTKTLLRGGSARVVVTMGMPSVVYRLWFLGHGIAGMKRSILHFVGITPVRETLFGMVAGASDATRATWIRQMRCLGERARVLDR